MGNDKIKGTLTEQNLINSFAGESQARNRYDYFAKVAQKEGYEQIAAIFRLTACNEEEHAKLFYEHIPDTKGCVDGCYPFEYGNTEENLKSAIEGEHEEWDILYANGEKTAREEGFDEIADTFKHVREAEKHHERRYRKLLEHIQNKTVFEKDYETDWLCRKCGYVWHGKSAPNKCPNCHHPKAYFEVLCETY